MEIDYTSFDFVKRHYAEIPGDEIIEDHHIDWYDGPLSGIAVWRDKLYYYTIIGEDRIIKANPKCETCGGNIVIHTSQSQLRECDECVRHPSCFGLYKVSNAIMDKFMYWQYLFNLCVENENVKADPDIRDFLFKFYYARRKKDYRDIDMTNEVTPVGWFKW